MPRIEPARAWLDLAGFRRALHSDPSGPELSALFDPGHAEARFLCGRDAAGFTDIAVHYAAMRQIGLWLRADRRGRGLARSILARALAGIDTAPLFATVEPDSASERVFLACGFRRAGTGRHRRVLVRDTPSVAPPGRPD